MELRTCGDLKYFVFKAFEETNLVNHCFSTRVGGVSTGDYSSLNLSFSRNDKRENVIKNYEIICNAIGSDYRNTVMSKAQIHSTNIYFADEKDCGKGVVIPNNIGEVDGFITDRPNVILTTFHADCTPLFFLDMKKKVIGVSHAGWRGTVNGMAKVTIESMVDKYGCSAENIIVGIGPCISTCCFQVDQPVVNEFKEKLEFSKKFIFEDTSEDGKYKIDLVGVNRELLENCGIKAENIHAANICTKCNGDLFYSHRAMGDARGNMAAMMELKD